ncbi:MAG: HDIG domain-containing metalloprotein [Treponemataceae bacterium]
MAISKNSNTENEFSTKKTSKKIKFELTRQKNALLVTSVTFLTVIIITFFDLSAQKTSSFYSFLDYEVGQIADRTIISDVSIQSEIKDDLHIDKGEKITKKGFVITEENLAKFQLLLNHKESDFSIGIFFKYIAYLLLLSFFSFLVFSSVVLDRTLQLKELIFLAINFIFVYTLTSLIVKIPYFASAHTLTFVVPSSMCILLTAILLGQKTANSFSFVLSFGVFAAAGFASVPALFVAFSGIFTTRLILKITKRIDLVFVSIKLACIHFFTIIVLQIVFPQDIVPFFSVSIGCAVGGFLSGILAIGFLTPLETLLNTASVFRLIDLSDLNNPIMKKMLLTAPGTYSHSMMVASLSETACADIHANPLLARVGSYYHDLGKMEQPEYFVENQTRGNKHDEINPRLSVSVIRNHIKKGIEKAHQMRLPPEVIDIVAEHHGNGLISYFYNEAKKQDINISPEEFSYTGNPPSSKESAVVMLADTVEAACRTLDKPSVSRLEKFIKQLVMQKIEHGQLDKSNLTFKELDVIQASFVKILAGYYHSRIEYPNQKDPDSEKTEEQKNA